MFTLSVVIVDGVHTIMNSFDGSIRDDECAEPNTNFELMHSRLILISRRNRDQEPIPTYQWGNPPERSID